MTQPSFVPITDADAVRPARRLEVPAPWSPTRPAEVVLPRAQRPRGFGRPGPDQGYALTLAARLEDRLRLAPGESAEDALVGAALLASRRAGAIGRAPTIRDVTWALTIFGFLSEDAPAELVAERGRRFRSVAEHYAGQRRLVDSVPESSLGVSEEAAGSRLSEWRELVGAGAPPG